MKGSNDILYEDILEFITYDNKVFPEENLIAGYNDQGEVINFWLTFKDIQDFWQEQYNPSGLIMFFDMRMYRNFYKVKRIEKKNGVFSEEPTAISFIHFAKMMKYIFAPKAIPVIKDKYKTYLMKDNTSGLFKIGRSKNPKFREATLQSQKPSIDLIFIIEKDVEKELHLKYASLRLRGEWFKLTTRQVNNIKKTHHGISQF